MSETKFDLLVLGFTAVSFFMLGLFTAIAFFVRSWTIVAGLIPLVFAIGIVTIATIKKTVVVKKDN